MINVIICLISFQAMPVIVLDLKVPAPLEEGLDLVRIQARRLRRRLRINWSRKWSVFRYGLRNVFENFKRTEDEKPIMRSERGENSITLRCSLTSSF